MKKPTPVKKVPVRTCVACRTSDAKRTLRRVVRTPEGVFPDESGKRNGRGAYLCLQAICWQKVLARPQILAQALRTELTPADLERLRAFTASLPAAESNNNEVPQL